MGALVCWMQIGISTQCRGWGHSPQKLFGVIHYADMLVHYACGHLYVYGGWDWFRPQLGKHSFDTSKPSYQPSAGAWDELNWIELHSIILHYITLLFTHYTSHIKLSIFSLALLGAFFWDVLRWLRWTNLLPMFNQNKQLHFLRLSH